MSNSKQALQRAEIGLANAASYDGRSMPRHEVENIKAALSVVRSALQQQDADALSDERIMELAKAHTWFNGSHAMTDYVKFARAAIDAAMKAGETRDAREVKRG